MRTSPCKPHCFSALVLQASIFNLTISRGSFSVLFANIRKNLKKYLFFTLPCILAFKALYLCWTEDVLTFAYFIQQFISNVPFLGQTFSEYIWDKNLILSLDQIKNNQKIMQLIFAGGLGGCVGLSLFETWFNDSFKLPMVAAPVDLGDDLTSGKIPSIKIPLTLQSTQGSDLNLGSDSASSNVPEQRNDTPSTVPEYGPLWETIIYKFKNNMEPGFKQYVRVLKQLNEVNYTLDVPENNQDPNITEVVLAQRFFIAQKYQADILMRATGGREKWLRELRYYLSDVDKAKIEEISDKLDKAQDDFLDKTDTLAGTDPEKLRVEIKQFFDYTNTYRNTVKKELAAADSIMRKGLKEHSIYEKKELRQMINSDYPKALKAFYDEDNYLKKRIMEVLNEPSRRQN